MTNAEIADVFDQIADLLEFQGANPFRVRAYRNAARTLRELTESLEQMVYNNPASLQEISGIGADLADKIALLVRTGSLPLLEELREQTPIGVLEVMRVPGLGPKRAATLYRELGVSSLEQLREACTAQKVRDLPGFGAKTEEKILQGIELAAEAGRRTLWAVADQLVQNILGHMKQCKEVRTIQPAGSYRRGKDTVGDLDFLVITGKPAAVMDHFSRLDGIAQELARGDTKMSVRLAIGVQVDVRVVPEESFGAAMQYFTGSKAHNVVLRGMAKAKGLKINEYGVFRGQKRIAGRTEEEVYGVLDLPCFPPELREAREEFDWAAQGQLPVLVELADIRGDLHAHTDWTDGQNTLEEMAEAARQRGLQYLAIADHSKRVSMAHGLDTDRLRRQWDEIDRLNERWRDFRLLKSVEVDILERGGLDLPDKVLAEADWVVASVHYGQNQSREQITKRVVDALAHPAVCVFAHPTGRLLNERPPYAIDLEAVLESAKKYGKTIELNSHPARLDLDDVGCAAARKLGVPVVISTDAHSTTGLDVLRYGVLQARRGGLTKQDVANTRPWPELKQLLGRS
ncbi:MAG TPA: DNA polymerase/3'-5' exonuclease PolX [Thermoguttaceae bacterium]|nr:DNA polymerase/3'-5' exonuclease PolX [Thermoguttaceae bacterium]